MFSRSFSAIVISTLAFLFASAAFAGGATFDKPLVVLVYDQTCHVWCDKVRPMIKDLKVQYGDRVTFAELDATQSVLSQTKKTAKEIGIDGYLGDFRDSIPLVAVFSSRRSLIKELTGPKTIDKYREPIEAALGSK